VALTSWLIDKSALVRLAASPNAADWADRIERGLVRIATVTRLEIGYSVRSGPDLRSGYVGLRCPPCRLNTRHPRLKTDPSRC